MPLEFPRRLHYDALDMGIVAGPVAKMAVVVGLAAPLLFAGLSSHSSDRAKKSASKLADELLAGLGTDREPGAAVMVQKDGRFLYIGCRGVADLQAMRPIDGRTNFRLASVSKAFTAAAVMLLVRDGRLGYDDTLSQIFPDFPAYGRTITVRHLLQPPRACPITKSSCRRPIRPSRRSGPRSTTPGSSSSSRLSRPAGSRRAPSGATATRATSCSASSSRRSRARPSPAFCGTVSSSR